MLTEVDLMARQGDWSGLRCQCRYPQTNRSDGDLERNSVDADSDLQSIGRGGGRFRSGGREGEHDRHMSHIELGLVRV